MTQGIWVWALSVTRVFSTGPSAFYSLLGCSALVHSLHLAMRYDPSVGLK